MTSTSEKDDVKEQSTSSEREDDVISEDAVPLEIDLPGIHECDEPINVVFYFTGNNGRILRVHFNTPSWRFMTQWNIGTQPETYYLQLSDELCDNVYQLKLDNADLISIQSSKLMFTFGHETRNQAFLKARGKGDAHKTIERFLKKVDSNVRVIKIDGIKIKEPTEAAAAAHEKRTGRPLEKKNKDVPQGVEHDCEDDVSKSSNTYKEGRPLEKKHKDVPQGVEHDCEDDVSKSSNTNKEGRPLEKKHKDVPQVVEHDCEDDVSKSSNTNKEVNTSIAGMKGNSKAKNSTIVGQQRNNTTSNDGVTYNFDRCTFLESQWSIKETMGRALSKPSQSDCHTFGQKMCECHHAEFQGTELGSLIFLFRHKSRRDALNMIIKHKQVKGQILLLLRIRDSEVTDIKVAVKLNQPGRRHQSHNFVQMELANLKKRHTAIKNDWQRHVNFLFEEMDLLRLFSVRLKRLMTELDRKKKALRHPPVDDLSPVCDGRDLLAIRMKPQVIEFKQRILGQEDVLCSIKEFLVEDKILIGYFQTKIDSWIMKQRLPYRDLFDHDDDDGSAAINLESELQRVTQQVNMERNSERDSGDKERDETKTGEMGQMSIKFQDMMKRAEDIDESHSSHFDEPSISKGTLSDDYTASQERVMRAAETQICIAEIAEQEKTLLTLEEEQDHQKRHLDSLYCDLSDEWLIKVHYLQRHQDVLSLYNMELPEVISEMVRPGPSHIQTAKLEISPEDKSHQRPVKRSQIAKLRRFQQGLLKESDLFDIIGNMIVDDEDHLASLQALNGPVYLVGPSSLQVVCPKLHLDAARANTEYCHVTTDGELVNSPSDTRSRDRLHMYMGTCASTPIPLSPLHPALTPVYNTPRYWETRTRVRVVGKWWYVLEMGVVEAGLVDSEWCVYLQPRSWCVRVGRCGRHGESLCTRVCREEEPGECHQNTMSDTPGTQATLHYGVVLDVERGRIAFIDFNRGIVIGKFDERFGEDLYPVFSVGPSGRYTVNMELISGDNIAITDTKMSLIHDALT